MNEHAKILRSKLEDLSATVGVIGLGYVGLPLCLSSVRGGLKTIGFDIDPEKPRMLEDGRSYLKHIGDDRIAQATETGRFQATSDIQDLSAADVIVICVPTPLTRHREPDLSYLTKTSEDILGILGPGKMIALESTTYPGTTDEIVRPILEKSGLKAGEDFFLVFSPEREDPGNMKFEVSTIPKVVGADTPEAQEAAQLFYSIFVEKVVTVSTTRTAEMVKLTENIFRSVNIALVNELKIITEAMDIDIWEVIDAAKSKPFGFMPFYPGTGLGGHCIPIDPFYLSWKAKEFEIATRFIELAGEINSAMPNRIVTRLSEALDAQLGMALSKSRLLIIGMAYKKNVDDMRESPALKIMSLLEERGAIVEFYDPHVAKIPVTREYRRLAGRMSQPWSDDIGCDFDAAVIITDHDCVDYDLLTRNAKLVIDTRNACRNAGVSAGNVILA